MKKELGQCEATLPELGYLARPERCSCKAKYTENGRQLCGIHCAAANKKRYKRARARHDKTNKKIDRMHILLKMAKGLTMADLKKCHITFKR